MADRPRMAAARRLGQKLRHMKKRGAVEHIAASVPYSGFVFQLTSHDTRLLNSNKFSITVLEQFNLFAMLR